MRPLSLSWNSPASWLELAKQAEPMHRQFRLCFLTLNSAGSANVQSWSSASVDGRETLCATACNSGVAIASSATNTCDSAPSHAPNLSQMLNAYGVDAD